MNELRVIVYGGADCGDPARQCARHGRRVRGRGKRHRRPSGVVRLVATGRRPEEGARHLLSLQVPSFYRVFSSHITLFTVGFRSRPGFTYIYRTKKFSL